jgi:hypothetical protein
MESAILVNFWDCKIFKKLSNKPVLRQNLQAGIIIEILGILFHNPIYNFSIILTLHKKVNYHVK